MSDFKDFIEAYEKVIHPEEVAYGMKYFKMIESELDDFGLGDNEDTYGAFVMTMLLNGIGLKKEEGEAYKLQEAAVDDMWCFSSDAIYDFLVNGKTNYFKPEHAPIMNEVLKTIMKYVKANDWASLNDDVKKQRVRDLVFEKIPRCYLT